MGTSKRYYPPSSSSWPAAKAGLSKLAGSRDSIALPELVGKFVGLVLDDAEPLGRRNAEVVTHAVRSIGSFIQSLQNQANERAGIWRNLGIEPGMSLHEIDRVLVDALLPVADTRVDVSARKALLRLLHELLDPTHVEDPLHLLEERLTTESIDRILCRYVAYFVYELFLGDFSEILLGRYPSDIVDSTCQAAQDYILARVDQMLAGRISNSLNWMSSEGLTAANELVREVWHVLEGDSLP